MQELRSHPRGNTDRSLAGRIDAFGWGLFFIWAGIAFLADVGWRLGILGVGVIALGAQAARRYLGLTVDLFGLGMGLAMVAWGAWGFVQPRVGVLEVSGAFWPALFIAVGLVLVVRALRRPPHPGKGPADVQREEA